ncbi:hypothetical protein IAU59_000225 [Kwoniella sp. CBS 9459]
MPADGRTMASQRFGRGSSTPHLTREGSSSSDEPNLITPPNRPPDIPVVTSKEKQASIKPAHNASFSSFDELPRVGNIDSPSTKFVNSFKQLKIEGELCNQLRQATRSDNSDTLHQSGDLVNILRPASQPDVSSLDAENPSTTAGSELTLVIKAGEEEPYKGQLWDVFRGTLALESAEGEIVSSEVPVVIKLLDTNKDVLEARLQTLANNACLKLDPKLSSLSAEQAFNEDKILRQLFKFQGHFVPSYFGLYGTRTNGDDFKVGTDTLVMIMEDVGEQAVPPLGRGYYQFTTEERYEIYKQYLDLHEFGKVVQSESRIKVRHILRRKRFETDSDKFALIDFQKAQSLGTLKERRRRDLITSNILKMYEEWAPPQAEPEKLQVIRQRMRDLVAPIAVAKTPPVPKPASKRRKERSIPSRPYLHRKAKGSRK